MLLIIGSYNFNTFFRWMTSRETGNVIVSKILVRRRSRWSSGLRISMNRNLPNRDSKVGVKGLNKEPKKY